MMFRCNDAVIEYRKTKEYRKERAALLRDNPRYIEINVHPNRAERRSARYAK